MGRIFFAYDPRDRDLARSLEKGLEAKGHVSVWRVDELVAGRGWAELMPRRVASADAVVAIITEHSEGSISLWCEVGAARVLATGEKRTALLPVVVDLERAPGFTADILVLWANKENSVQELVGKIDSAIQAHLTAIQIDATRTSSPRIFISHRHKDKEIAAALAETIRTAFDLRASDIRCTSVQPYRLSFGKNTGERLRDEIARAQVVLGILTPDTSESTYVMFELGAAWSQRIYTCPLLATGADYNHIPGPIFDLAPARLWESSDCHQLLDNLGSELGLVRSRDTQGAVSERIAALTKSATVTRTSAP
jgi:hypothetical protein